MLPEMSELFLEAAGVAGRGRPFLRSAQLALQCEMTLKQIVGRTCLEVFICRMSGRPLRLQR